MAGRALQYAIEAASLGSLYGLFACGMALMFSVARIANFAYGDLMMVGAYVLLASHALPWPLVVVIVIAAGAILNVAVDRVAFRRLRSADGATLLVASFGVSILIQNVTLIAAGAQPKSVNFASSLGTAVHLGTISFPRLDLLTLGIAAAVFAGLAVFLRRSMIGIQLRAASEDFTMSRLLGVRANRVIATAFALSGMIAGAAAIVLTTQSGSLSIAMGSQPTLIAFIAVVIGGMGSLAGATIGGILLGVVSVVLSAALPSGLQAYRDAILFNLVILMLLVRPHGLFGERAAAVRV